MYYDKRIRYLSYYESDIKLQNAGYVKFQVRDSLCQMIIYVKGPRIMGSGETTVYLLSRKEKESDEDSFYVGSRDSHLQKHLLGNLSIRGGQGHCAVRMNAENMADSGLRYDEICGIRIELHEYQYLESLWYVMNRMPDRRQPQENTSGSEGYRLRREEEDKVQEDCTEWEISENAEPQIAEMCEDIIENISDDEDSMQGMLEREARKEVCEASQKTAEEATEEVEKAEAVEAAETAQLAQSEEIEETAQSEAASGEEYPEQELRSDKWEQLRATYPVVHPIREEEEYLKISPKDFVILNERYQELVHNSFLLHGYYNYKHLILGKKVKDGKVVYYLGVPGTFHDREKAVAVMFGFEAFDGKREPAQTGDFGYYLRRVEL